MENGTPRGDGNVYNTLSFTMIKFTKIESEWKMSKSCTEEEYEQQHCYIRAPPWASLNK